MKTHYMIDIETTGVNKETDDILEIGIVPIELDDEGFWYICNKSNKEIKQLHLILFSNRRPENKFAKEHMVELYDRCNKLPSECSYTWATKQVNNFIHRKNNFPKFFMGWNASNFDIPFLFKKNILEPSRYEEVADKEILVGDVHYRIYEQTGALNLMLNSTGFSKKTVFSLGYDLIPEHLKIELPKGKKHDAIFDCYNQINMMNGLIALARKGWNLHERRLL